MLGLYLGLIAAWLWGCLVFAPKPGRAVILLLILPPWMIFLAFGSWLFDRLTAETHQFFFRVGPWLDGLGQPAKKGGAA